MRLRSHPVPRLATSYCAGGAFFHFIVCLIVSSRLVSSRLAPRVEYSGAYGVSSCSSSRASSRPSFRRKQGGSSRRSISSCPCGEWAISSSRLVRRLGFSCRQGVSPPSRRPVPSHQMRASKQGGGGVSSRSLRPVPSSVRRAGRPRGSRVVPGGIVASSSSHPRQASRRWGNGSASWRGRLPCSLVPPWRQ